VDRALALFEHSSFEMSDRAVLELLRLLKIGRFRLQRGRAATWAKGPVDFSDLRTEYIGMMYEGLLDYELKRAPEPLVFVRLGPEPALPLARLEAMSDEQLKEFVQKLKKGRGSRGGKRGRGPRAGGGRRG